MSKEEIKCSWCGDSLSEEELECPSTNSEDEPICEDCYREHYEFRCEWCEEHGETKDQHNLLLVLEAETVRIESEEGYLKPGVYQIVEKPYYGTDYFDSWILWQAIVWLCDLPGDMDVAESWCPCGHLCLECQNKIWEQIGARPLSDKVA